MTDSDPTEDGSGAASPFPAAYGSVSGGGGGADAAPARPPGRRRLSELTAETGGTRVSAADRRRLAKLASLESGSPRDAGPARVRTRRRSVGEAADRWEPGVAPVPTVDGPLASTSVLPKGGASPRTAINARPGSEAGTDVRTPIAPRRVPAGPLAPVPAGPDGAPDGRNDPADRRTPDWLVRRIVESEMPDAEYELGRDRRWRRRKVTVTRSRSSRRLVRRIDTWTVFKVSLIFYLLLLVVVLVAGLVTWSVAQHLGFVGDIQKSVRSLADDRKFILHGSVAFKYSAAGGAVLGLIGTLFNTVAAMLYNLLSDVIGGVQVIVVSEPD